MAVESAARIESALLFALALATIFRVANGVAAALAVAQEMDKNFPNDARVAELIRTLGP